MDSLGRATRDRIITAIVRALEPEPFVLALWEGGALAFGRLDEWSDIDICVSAEDDRILECFPIVERALETVAPIKLKQEVKQTLSPGYVQAFYRLEGTPDCMLVDLAIFKATWPDKLLEPEIHGTAKFHFNKGGRVKIPHLDPQKLSGDLRNAVTRARMRFEVFNCFVPKELARGNLIEAVTLYHRVVLDSLVDVLRIKHKPVRFDFKTRYIHYDLPREVTERLQDLYLIRDREDLEKKYLEAKQWFLVTVNQLEHPPLPNQ